MDQWSRRLAWIHAVGQSTTLNHQTRNQINALALACQTVILQSQLGHSVDTALLDVAIDQWNRFEAAFPSAIRDEE